ncbi:flagella synthesis protein FlgN [uncultured Microbulbifer sp.]|uniref:flagella synthesis protein FlgN n=1 Tax=uncultured Microbulbifer sp. TaxID=348147 RepID=UPI0026049793|nr:flagellar protein FlgN [uncultured Microbulbifer sp.]
MSLPQFIQQHRQRVEQLTLLLHEEREALSAAAVDGKRLTDIAARKQNSLSALNDFEQQRRNTLRQLDYEDSREGDEYAARDAGCLELWRELISLVNKAQQLNQANGSMIGIRSESNQRLLNALQEAAGKGLYGPDGRSRTHNGKINSRA